MKTGFTLIELLIVIAIIAILALIAIPNFLEAQIRAKVSRVQADMRMLATGMEAYYVDYNAYPRRDEPGKLHDPLNYSGGLDRVTALSTPIAYLTTLTHRDLFYRGPEMDRAPVAYMYYNFHGAYKEDKAYPSEWQANGGKKNLRLPQEIRFNGFDAPTQPGFWALISRGPDRKYEDPKLGGTGGFVFITDFLKDGSQNQFLQKGRSVTYDPTNGTVSPGNIWRLSGEKSGREPSG